MFFKSRSFLYFLASISLIFSTQTTVRSVEAADHSPRQIAATFAIAGRVVDGSGDGIEGATILAIQDNYKVFLPQISAINLSSVSTPPNPNKTGQNFYTAISDAGGYYTLSGLPAGRYRVSASKAGIDFNPLSYTVSPTNASGHIFTSKTIPTTYSSVAENLSSVSTDHLVSISLDGSLYSFDSLTTELSAVAVGDVIIGGECSAAPEGFLRKVTAVQNTKSNVILTTEQATLEDAFESLSFYATKKLTPADIKDMPKAPGIKLISDEKSEEFIFELDNSVIYDKDNNLSTTDDQIVTNGRLVASPEIEIHARLEGLDVKEFYFKTIWQVETELTVSSGISISLATEKKLFPSISLGAVPAGPITIFPKLDLVAGISGEIYAGISTTISQTTTFTSGMQCLEGDCASLNSFQNDFSFSPLDFPYGVAFKFYVGPKLSFKLYDVLGPYAQANFALKLDIAPASNPWLTLQGGLEASVGFGVEVPIINKELVNVSLLAIDKYYTLLQRTTSNNNQPNPPHNPSPANWAIDLNPATTLNWSGSDPDGDALVYDLYLNTGADFPFTKVADHQSSTTFNPGPLALNTDYVWKVIAFDEHGLSTEGPVWRFSTLNPGDMAYIPAGNFQMGCDTSNPSEICNADELPLHTIYLDAYYLDKFEVTNAQYAQCVTAGSCTAPTNLTSSTRAAYYNDPAYALFPVIYVDWSQAKAYCEWAGKRLPTEAEWEKAARGDADTRKYPWGNESPTCSQANFQGCFGDTVAIGSFPDGASPYGVLDIAGNVSEWVNDYYDPNYYAVSPGSNPPGPTISDPVDYRVLRGFHWWNPANVLRVARRGWSWQVYSNYSIGIRCAKTP